ncbi:transposase [Ichthyobacterium seriolicida]|uniref:Transposase n=2 Tax=Ichthyobacterium seriolicida TaxID=242600 RepID=A0A1J1E879_9FLAO|nr:transposase [Ichthyobacterium seriolicida]
MWLSAQQVVDHNTIVRFRSKKLKTIFKDIFKQVVLLLADEGLLTQIIHSRMNFSDRIYHFIQYL